MNINTFVLMKPPYVFQLLFGSDIRLKKNQHTSSAKKGIDDSKAKNALVNHHRPKSVTCEL